MPKVSIIIPAYNLERLINQTIDSVLAQTYPDFEVIVVDDGSTDNTRSVLASYGNKINCIYQQNKGPAAARNTGFQAAQGDYFLFLDHDDLIPPNKLDLQAAILESHPEFGVVYSGWQFINQDGTLVLSEVRPNRQGHLLKDLLRRSFSLVTPGAALVRRECFEQIGLFDETLIGNDDIDLWTRIARAGYAFGYVDELLLQFRIHESLSTKIPDLTLGEFTRLDKFFADPNLPDDIKAIKAEVYSIIHYETASRYYRVGAIASARDHIRKAIATYPPLASNEEWLLEWIAGFALEPRTTTPFQTMETLFDNLPSEAKVLRSLRKRAYGRYHTAAAFLAYQNHHLKKVRRHILPALRGDPAIIRNRGFVRIALQSLFT